MTPATSRRSRITIVEGPDALRIVIPARRPGSSLYLGFFGLWLSFTNLMVITAALGLIPVEGGYDPGTFAAMSLVFNAVGLPIFLWYLIGRTAAHLDDRVFSIRLELCGLAWTRTFDPARISDLHVIANVPGEVPGCPAFRYDGRRRTFGALVTDAESRSIIEAIERRLARSRPE